MGMRDTPEATLPAPGAISAAEAQAILAAGEAIERHRSTAKRAPDYLHAMPYVILRDADGAERIEWLENQKAAPSFRKGLVKFGDAPSFINYFNRHKSSASAIYATINPCRFVAVLDEHPDEQAPTPSWRDFRAEFAPTLSTEWETWFGHDGIAHAFKSTEEFAYFIEDNAPDFVKPEAAASMEIAVNFRATEQVSYSKAQRLNDGHVELAYTRLVNGAASGSTGKVVIPEIFELSIPLFAGLTSPNYTLEARLRYRITGSGVVLWYDLVRPHKVLEAGFKSLFTEIHDGTTREVFVGVTD